MSVIDLIQDFKADLLGKEAATMREMAARWAGVTVRLERGIDALSEDIAEMKQRGETVSESKVRELERYKALYAQATREAVKYSAYVDETVAAAATDAIEIGKNGAIESIEDIAGDAVFGLSFDTIDTGALDALAGLLQDGSPVRAALLKHWPGHWAKVEQTLIDGAAMGLSPREIAARIVNDIGGMLGDSLRIARTEILRSYREATRETYKQSGVVTAYKRLATKDTRTCAACLALDGKRHKLEEPLIDHPNGRCTLVPIVTGAREVKWQTADEWFERLDAEDQRKILGPGKFEAWREGKFAFADLAKQTQDPVWGGQLKVASLEELTGDE